MQRRVDRHAAGSSNQQVVAIGHRVRDDLRADDAAGATAVIDDDRLLPRFGKPLAERTRHRIRWTAGRKGDDDANRLAWKILSASDSTYSSHHSGRGNLVAGAHHSSFN